MINGHDIDRQRERLPTGVPRLPPFSELIESTNRNANIVSPTSQVMRSRLFSTSSWPYMGHSRQPSDSMSSSQESSLPYLPTRLDKAVFSSERGDLLPSSLYQLANPVYNGYKRSMLVGGHAEFPNSSQQNPSLRRRLSSLTGSGPPIMHTAESVYDRHEEVVKSVRLASTSLSEILLFQEMLELKFNNFMELQFAASHNRPLNEDRDSNAVLAFEEFILYFSMSDLNQCVKNSKNVTFAVENIKRAQAEYYKRQQHFALSTTEKMPRFTPHAPQHHLAQSSQALLLLQYAAHQLRNFEQGARDQHLKMLQDQESASMQKIAMNKENLSMTKKRKPSQLPGIEKTVPHSGGEVMAIDIHVSPIDDSGHNQDYGLGGLNSELSVKPNIACQHCGSRKTPEWRRGPDGSRTLCNACGLFYSKMIKKYGLKEANMTMKERKRAGLVMDRHIV